MAEQFESYTHMENLTNCSSFEEDEPVTQNQKYLVSCLRSSRWFAEQAPRSGPPPLNENITLLLGPGVHEIISQETALYASENLETGGILVGKWLDAKTVLLVAATDAGPNADHQQMTFAIDIDHANDQLGR